MDTDFIDHLVEQWVAARPDLDSSPMHLAARLVRVGVLLERRLAAGLAVHGLTVGEFDLLATLRRHGAEPLPPRRLIEQLLLSSGAMTNRIDRLEARGLVERLPDPADRRGVLVRLTPKGRRVIDPAVADRFADARDVAGMLRPAQLRALITPLRQLARTLETEDPT